jgi:hypothetical protein
MVNDYFITGLPRLNLHVVANVVRLVPYILPIILMLMEVTFITDMMGGTNILTPYLNGKAALAKKTS